ncbi:MAG: PH domain-containing protein [Gammaproteobacteria bacterium]|nr:PH domain-containing protein [Gammaproteobacteria bacterium]
MVVDIIFPETKAVVLFGGLVASLLGLGGWLAFGGFASGTTKVAGVGVAILAAVLVGYLLLFATASLRIEREAVVLDMPIYGHAVDRRQVVQDGARALDLMESTDQMPTIRTNGIGLPGLLVGHVKLRDGTKARVALTDKSSVLYLPLSDGSAWMVSVVDPDHVAARLTES